MIERYQGLLRAVVSIFAPLANKIDVKFKNKALTVLFGLTACCALFYSSAPISVHILIKCIIGCAILGLIIFFSIDGPINKVVWDKKFVGIWLAFGLIRLITGVVTSFEFLPLACVWLIVFPMLFIVWNNRKDYETLFRSLCYGFLCPIVVFFVLSLCLIPITDVGFVGLAGNPNAIGQFVCAVFPLILARYGQKVDKTGKDCNGLIVLISFLITVTLYTDGRTATLTVVALLIVWALYTIFITKRIRKKFYMALGKIVVITLVMFFSIIKINAFLVPLLDYPSWGILTYRGSGSFGLVGQDMYSFGEFPDETAGINQIVNGYLNRISGNDKHASGIDNYSSGRTVIWKATIKKLNLLGHPSRDHIYTERNGDIGVNVHNIFLQFAYDHGIFGGILFVVFCIVMFWKIFFVIDKGSKYYESVLYTGIAFFMVALVTSINLPFLYIITFAFYVCCSVLFEDNGKSYKPDLSDFKTNFKNK